MGQITPDGVTEQKTSQQEQNPAADFDVRPDPLINEFFNTLEDAVQEDPAAEDAVDLLIREIQETTGLYTGNPNMQAQASSRMEQLNSAIQDSNMPEEIKSSFNNIYTTSIDSPHYLNVLNGFIQQGGGSIAGISGAAQRMEEERIAKRNDADNRAAAAGTAAMIQSAARVNAANENYSNTMDDWTKKLLSGEITFEQYREEHDKASEAAFAIAQTDEEARQIRDSQIEDVDNRVEKGELNDNQGEANKASIIENYQKISNDLTSNRNQSISSRDNQNDLRFDFLSAGLNIDWGAEKEFDFFNLGMGTNLNTENPTSPTVQSKEDFNSLVDQYFDSTAEQIQQQKQDLQESKNEYDTLKADIESFWGQTTSLFGLNAEDEALLEQMEADIAEQEYILNLQEEVNTQTRAEVEKLLSKIDGPSDIDIDFLKQAFLEMDHDLVAKTAELDKLLGTEDSNPITQLQAMLENQGAELTEEQRADLTEFIDTVTEMKSKIAEADAELENQTEAYINRVSVDGLVMQQDAGWGGVPSVLAPENRLSYAMDEKQRLQEEYEAYLQEQGASIPEETQQQEEAPAPAPDEPSHMDVRATEMAQELAAMDNVTRADLEQMVYNDNWIGPMQIQMEEKLEAELRANNPDFQFADMSVEDRITMAFIDNEGTLSQQDIELIISEAGVDGAEFQTTVDSMIEKYSGHESFRIDPPVASAAAEYEPGTPEIAAEKEPEPAKPNEQEQELELEEQEYARTNTAQSPALY